MQELSNTPKEACNKLPCLKNETDLFNMKLILGLSLVCGIIKISRSNCALDAEYFCSTIPKDFPLNLKSILFVLTDIGVINSTVFRSPNLKSVASLTLAHSGITRIDPGAFHAFQGLTKLGLYGNHLTTVAASWLSNPGRLENLTMSNNRLSELGPRMLSGFTNLTILNLGRNQIHSVSTGTFKNLPELTQIDLSYNRITALKRNVFADLRYPTVKLGGNPWNCSCELQDFAIFLQELMNATKLDDAFSVTCHSPPDLNGTHVWNVSSFNCSTDIFPSTADNMFSKAGLPTVIVGLVLLLFLWLLLVLWKKKQDTKQVQPDHEQTAAKGTVDKGKESGIYIISKGSLNLQSPEEHVQKPSQKDSKPQWETAKGRAKSASAILFKSDFPQASMRCHKPYPENQELSKYTNEMITEHSRVKRDCDSAVEQWYFNNLQDGHGKILGSNDAKLSTGVNKVCLIQDPLEFCQDSLQSQNAFVTLSNNGTEGITQSENPEPLLYFIVDRAPDEPRQTEASTDTGSTPGRTKLEPRSFRRTLTWPQEKGQWDQDQNPVFLHEDVFKEQHNISSDPPGMFMANRMADPEGEQDEDYDMVLNSLTNYQMTQLDHVQGLKQQAPPSNKLIPSSKKVAESGKAMGSAYRSSIKKASKGSRSTNSRQKPHNPCVSQGNSQDDDLHVETSEDRAGHTGSPTDDTLLENNDYNFIDLLHEVVQNHGRWTRERWKQTHQQRMASRPFLQTE